MAYDLGRSKVKVLPKSGTSPNFNYLFLDQLSTFLKMSFKKVYNFLFWNQTDKRCYGTSMDITNRLNLKKKKPKQTTNKSKKKIYIYFIKNGRSGKTHSI